MKTERELFEEEFKKINCNIVFWLNTWDEEMQGYNHPTMCWIWHIWQASAQREGYKLVPVESTKEHIHKFEEITVNGDDARKYICIYCGFEKSESFND
mgnify:CR=1 FL=1